MTETKVVIVGAGPSGLGCAALFKQMGIELDDMMVLDAKTIGSSFEAWPEEMKMITPSFPSNGYHQTDLNAITPDTSPAFTTSKEHPNGKEYAQYLRSVAKHYKILVHEQTKVLEVTPYQNDSFLLKTDSGETIHSQYVIWAAGEFSSPKLTPFEGSEHSLHNSQIQSWGELTDDKYTVIGCYESGVDAAYNLASRGKQVTILDAEDGQQDTYDPSRVLSPYTSERLMSMANMDLVDLHQGFKVLNVQSNSDGFEITSTQGDTLTAMGRPINCTGFDTHLGPVSELFDISEQGLPKVNKFDESTRCRNLFLSGPKLAHGKVLLCFIYKFRGRFATPCSVIASELGLDTSILHHYQQAGMLLDDLACCEAQKCFC